MIDFANVKAILRLAGITKLKLTFDGDLQNVIAEYVFKGAPGHKQITWEEIIDNLTIGQPEQPASPELDAGRELK